MQRTKWVDRKWHFDIEPGLFPSILERLQGTYARMLMSTEDLAKDQLILRINNKWSIQEHLGHLLDIEDLHLGRIDDYKDRKEILRPADMTNVDTEAANFNEQHIDRILYDFNFAREHLINMFTALDEETLNFKSLHPRLQIKITPVELAYFIAEHDDHHLTTVREILRTFDEDED